MNLQITPAILTNDIEEARKLAAKYILMGTNQIDIDIADESFGTATISVDEACEVILEFSELYDLPEHFWGLDIAIQNASQKLQPVLAKLTSAAISPRVYLATQCGQAEYIWLIDQKDLYKGLVVEADTNITMQYPWHEFDEVQLMTIKQRGQGYEFQPNLLSKALKLKEKGFEGVISIDGGVSLTTAPVIAEYAQEELIGRISVGSFFQKAEDAAGNRDKLVLALTL